MSGPPVYTNLDLTIGPGQAGIYPVAILASPAGETREPTQVAIDPAGEPLRSWLTQLGAGAIGADDLVALGRRLADFLFGVARQMALRWLKELVCRLLDLKDTLLPVWTEYNLTISLTI